MVVSDNDFERGGRERLRSYSSLASNAAVFRRRRVGDELVGNREALSGTIHDAVEKEGFACCALDGVDYNS